jgi:hypothetical protein
VRYGQIRPNENQYQSDSPVGGLIEAEQESGQDFWALQTTQNDGI